MITVEFEYKDSMSHGNWNKQSCTAKSLREVIEWYGLGIDCEYHILSMQGYDEESKVLHS